LAQAEHRFTFLLIGWSTTSLQKICRHLYGF